MGRGETPVAAAQRALDSWRDFVTGTRVDLSMAATEESSTERPPQLNAPSAAKVADDDAGRKAV
jgi:hypothetical protein